MEKPFTHYALADPRVKDEVLRVRYIGRTKRSLSARLKGHMKSAREGGRCHRDLWITKLVSEGVLPLVIDLGEGPEEREALLIREYQALGADLTNRTVGGEGCPGFVWTQEMRAAKSEQAKLLAADPEWRRKVSEATASALNRPEMKAKIAEGVRRHYEKPGALEKRQELQREILSRPGMYEKLYSPQSQQKRSEAAKKNLSQPEVREKISEAIREARKDPIVARGYADRARVNLHTPEARRKRGAKIAASAFAKRRDNPENQQIAKMVKDGVTMTEIAMVLGLSWKTVSNRVRRMRKDGALDC